MTQDKKEEVRVRIAPSPTGYLHIGTARTALFNWLYAKHMGGKFILRIEDTDIQRSEERFEKDIISGLEWLGLKWDEFYRQSDRIKIYNKYIQKLLENKKAFYCYHSEEELEEEREDQMANKATPRHVCEFKKGSEAARSNPGGIIRLAIDENSKRKIKFKDVVRGDIDFEEGLLGDISIAKDLNTPLYNLAVVVDDYEMDITHVIRGEDHIANTPKQILIQEALDIEGPAFAHLPLILGPDKSKLSKRHAATSVEEYKKIGYLPDALVNFLSLLGWTPEGFPSDIIPIDDIASQFELNKVHKSGAIFDIKKLNWVNSQYIKKQGDQDLARLVSETDYVKNLENVSVKLLEKIAPLLRERLEFLEQIKEFHFFFEDPEYSVDLLNWKSRTSDEIKNSLSLSIDAIDKVGTDSSDILRSKLDEIGKTLQDRGLVYWPLRVALSGEKASPDPVDIALILGKEKTLSRVKSALTKLG